MMASLLPLTPTTPTPTALTRHSSLSFATFPFRNRLHVSCKSTESEDPHDLSTNSTNDNTSPSSKFERRNLLLGLGGFYGASRLGAFPLPSLAVEHEPVQTDFTNCNFSHLRSGRVVNCCPFDIKSDEITDFVLPPVSQSRTRPAAHKVDPQYIQQYEKAIQLMKCLSAEDPRNFYRQANIHCAYCDGAYRQVRHPDAEVQVHDGWLFLPWHRWYLYFFERICQKLLNDPSFSLPFWNWDGEPAGMQIPPLYNVEASPLYDSKRNPGHLPPVLVDLLYDADHPTPPEDPKRQIIDNYHTMRKQMVVTSSRPILFFGNPYYAGDQPSPKRAGNLEQCPHNTVHDWTGDPRQPSTEDMGVLYAAAQDPIFYAHHGNVDRMWNIWLGLDDKIYGGKHQNINDPSYLRASFVFFDENGSPVRVKVGDAIDSKNLGYTYQDVPIPWLNIGPTPRRTRAYVAPNVPTPRFPIALDKELQVMVKRPKKNRSKEEKEEEEEILVIDGIEFAHDEYVKFDVYINEDDVKLSGQDKTEFVGVFTHLPHGGQKKAKSSLALGITKVLEDLEVDDVDNLLVTLVPKRGLVAIGSVYIDYLS